MNWYHMSQEQILNSSWKFLLNLYKEYPERACENLGISPKKEEKPKYQSTIDTGYPEFLTDEEEIAEFYKKFNE